MTITAFLLILISVFLHAAWNFLSKRSSPSIAFYFIANGIGALACLGFALCSGVPWSSLSSRFWTFFLISNFFEICYFTGMAGGYRAGDISMVYPMGRSLPVILTAMATILFRLGKVPTAGASFGMFVIFCGCIIMPLKSWKGFSAKTYFSKLMLYVLVMAIGTTGYTIFDSLCMNELKTFPAKSDAWRSMFYIFLVELGVTLSLLVLMLINAKERMTFKQLYRSDVKPYVAGIFTSAAYGLVLLAMCHVTNVSFVQAFRQMSLPLGVVAGIVLLKESCTIQKILGAVLIISGLVVVAFFR